MRNATDEYRMTWLGDGKAHQFFGLHITAQNDLVVNSNPAELALREQHY